MDNRELERTIAGLFVVGFKGTSITEDVRKLLDMGLGGVILFSRNMPDLDSTVDLLGKLHGATLGPPLVMSLDQEGGSVQRLGPPVLQLPPMQILGRGGSELCKRAGAQLGAELRALGFCMDYAPVMDVDSNPANPVIGDRAFSHDPDEVAELAQAFADGLSEAGVANCAKHFPGHGDTETDSHLSLPRLSHSLERLRSFEMLPFKRAVEHSVDSVMMAHLLADSIDARVPTSLSKAAYEILRQELGFDGLCLTDDVEMGAVAQEPGVVDACVQAVAAGADGVLVCHRPELALDAIERIRALVQTGRLEFSQLEESANRWQRLRKKYHFQEQSLIVDMDRFEALRHSPERRRLEQDLDLLENRS